MMTEIKNLAKSISPIHEYLSMGVVNREQLIYHWMSYIFFALGLLYSLFLIVQIIIKIKNSKLNVIVIKKINNLNNDLKSQKIKISKAYTELIIVLKEVLNNRFNLNSNSMTDDEMLERVSNNDAIELEFKTFLKDLISSVKIIKFSDSAHNSTDFKENTRNIILFVKKWFK